MTGLDPFQGVLGGELWKKGVCPISVIPPPTPREDLPPCDPDQPRRIKAKSASGPSCQRARGRGRRLTARGRHRAGHSPPSPGPQGGPRERLRSGCSGSAAASGPRGPQSSRTPPCRDSRPVTGPPRPRPRRCCRCWSCRCWSCRCCTGPRRWRSRSGRALRRGASRSELADGASGEARGELVLLPRKAGRGRLRATPKPLLSPGRSLGSEAPAHSQHPALTF